MSDRDQTSGSAGSAASEAGPGTPAFEAPVPVRRAERVGPGDECRARSDEGIRAAAAGHAGDTAGPPQHRADRTYVLDTSVLLADPRRAAAGSTSTRSSCRSW